MPRLYFTAIAALLLSLVGTAPAHAVSLSPTFADNAAPRRFDSATAANVTRAPSPSVTAKGSTRCKELNASINAAVGSPDRHIEVVERPSLDGHRQIYQRQYDKRESLETEYASLGCPSN